MAKQLKKIFDPGVDEVVQNFTIESWHVSQSVDAFRGDDDYDITISGSLTISGSTFISGSPTATGAGYSTLVLSNTTGQVYVTGSYGGGGGGATGPQGPQGNQGNQGPGSNVAGPQGSQGNQGNQGPEGSGTQGPQGPTGPSGAAIITGSYTGSLLTNTISSINWTGSGVQATVGGANDITVYIPGGGGGDGYISNVTYGTGSIDFTGVGSAFNGEINISEITSSLLSTSSFNSATGSFYYSSSVTLNTITFFQGDGTSDIVVVNTGSGGGGGDGYISNVTYETGSIDFTGVGSAFDGEINISNITASLLSTSSFNSATGSFMTTGSVVNNTITFTKGDGTTFNITVDTGSGGVPSSVDLTTTSASADYRVLLVDEAGLINETLYVDSNDGLTFNPSLNYLQSKGEVIAYYASDRKLKDNITPISNPLEKLAKINGYEFDWNENQQVYKGHDVGVIAQEIEEILPELVTTRDNGDKAVKYEKLTAFLISVVKEQQKQIDELKSKL